MIAVQGLAHNGPKMGYFGPQIGHSEALWEPLFEALLGPILSDLKGILREFTFRAYPAQDPKIGHFGLLGLPGGP